ncbi:LytTR family transcriptional regulator, partial [Enterococcus faecalis]|nr:LytTR family transcriptional regulator [Listeria monocytogenes]EGO6146701.1 LytTR family transcriptional regulator [Enterococcus faecalis]EGO8008135.1 LytTR family transcriptional regulator [Enterococcus faecalis]EHB5050347.1 LytTR family transcriptional regulator [Enterococcus faecalis]HCT1441121.1 response regulator FsrA [Enterococcus faecalis]
SSIKMDINDIYFFQTEYDHRVSMVGKNFKREFYGTLSKIEQLHPDLIRVHQSIIINKKYASKLNYKTHLLTMRDGTEVPVSRRYYTQVKALFLT